MDNVSQFRAPQVTVVQQPRSPWANVLPQVATSFADVLLAQLVKNYTDSSKIEKAMETAGYQLVPEGTPPDPTRQTRTVGKKTYYTPMSDVYGYNQAGQLTKMGAVPEGSNIRELPQQPKVDTQIWRNNQGQYAELPKGDPRGAQLLSQGFLPVNISMEEQKLRMMNDPNYSLNEQQKADLSAFQEREKRQPNAQERAQILRMGDAGSSSVSGSAVPGLNAQQDQTAQKLVRGEIPYPAGYALRQPYWQGIVARAGEIDPTFNAATYQTRAAVKKSFTSGQDARNVTSINTLVGHLQSLEKSSKGLDNSKFQSWNTVSNWLESATGDPRKAKFEMDLDAVSSELAAVFKGSGATDQEIKAWRHNVNSSQSPAQLEAAINEGYELMFSRLGALRAKYEQGMGEFGTMQILSPKSREILKGRFGADYVSALESEVTQQGVRTSSGTPQTPQKGNSSVLQSGW